MRRGARRRIGPTSFVLTLVVTTVLWMATFAAALFVPAGTLHWWRGWVLIGALFVFTLGSTVLLLPTHRDLIAERMRPPIQRGQPGADKVVAALIVLTFYGLLVFTSLDVFRLHLLRAPGHVVSALGFALFFCGFWIAYLAVRENTFAAAAVKHSDRQTVIDTGVYGIVRHPMYAGAIPFLIGIPLWLQSYAGALGALVPVGTLMARSILEERFLRRELSGYDAYTRRVRYRIVPGVW